MQVKQPKAALLLHCHSARAPLTPASHHALAWHKTALDDDNADVVTSDAATIVSGLRVQPSPAIALLLAAIQGQARGPGSVRLITLQLQLGAKQ